MSKREFDLIISPIEFAVCKTIGEYADQKDEYSKIIYQSLIRSKVIWDNIKIHGIDYCGLSYEQFCDQCKDKPNVLFLSDDELERYKKALEIMDILNK